MKTITITCTLNCEKDGAALLHFRPAAFIVDLCNKFPETEFRITKKTEDGELSEEADPKSILALQFGCFKHGEQVTVKISGKCVIMASELFKAAWENLGEFSADKTASEVRLVSLLDETFNSIHDPDIEEYGGALGASVPEADSKADQECRSIAVINDRLHNLSLAILPRMANYFKCRLQIAFDVPSQGIFLFTMDPGSPRDREERTLKQIVGLEIEVGTRITVLTTGANRFKANAAVKNVLQSLWQCDDWIRKRAAAAENDATVVELVDFAEKTSLSQSPEYGFIQNPYISNLLTNEHVFVNPNASAFSKDDVLSQLAAAHARTCQLEVSLVLDRVREAERREPIVLRDGFAVAHGAMERTPRISLAFGVYPKGVQ